MKQIITALVVATSWAFSTTSIMAQAPPSSPSSAVAWVQRGNEGNLWVYPPAQQLRAPGRAASEGGRTRGRRPARSPGVAVHLDRVLLDLSLRVIEDELKDSL